MTDCYFTLIDEDAGVARYLAGPATGGPWAPHLLHGGPPNALAVAIAEQRVATETGRTDLVPMRLAADFVGPVPVGEIELRSRLVRAARSAALVEVDVSAGGRACLLARVWLVRSADTAEVAPAPSEPTPVPDAPVGLGVEFGYGQSLEWRFVRGRMEVPGPAAAWVRPIVGLCEGLGYSGLARTVLIADSASGISSELSWAQWSFLNVDLDVHLFRALQGEWLFMDATTHLGPSGAALARSTLSDVRGVMGAGLQTLVLAPMRTA